MRARVWYAPHPPIHPQLKVRKDWYKGLDESFGDKYIELSMFHHQDAVGMGERIGEGARARVRAHMHARRRTHTHVRAHTHTDRYGGGMDDISLDRNGGMNHRRAKEADTLSAHASKSMSGSTDSAIGRGTQRRLLTQRTHSGAHEGR